MSQYPTNNTKMSNEKNPLKFLISLRWLFTYLTVLDLTLFLGLTFLPHRAQGLLILSFVIVCSLLAKLIAIQKNISAHEKEPGPNIKKVPLTSLISLRKSFIHLIVLNLIIFLGLTFAQHRAHDFIIFSFISVFILLEKLMTIQQNISTHE